MRLPVLLALALVAGCSSGGASTAHPGPTAPVPQHPRDKVLVVVFENHDDGDALEQMHALRNAAHRHGLATDYTAATHPSLPNYLVMAGGSTFGVQDDKDPSVHALEGETVFDQALAHGRTAKTYADAMPSACAATDSGTYVVRHNPWAYFPDSRDACEQHDVPVDALKQDVDDGALPHVGFLVPDLCHDAHDCSLGKADAWFGDWWAYLQDGPDWRSGRLTVVVTFDENEHHDQPNKILTAVLDPALHGKVVTTPLTHYSLSAFLSEAAGAAPLRDAAGAPSLREAFFG